MKPDTSEPIPRIIHQTYKTSDEHKLPEHWLEGSRKWRALNPEYEYRKVGAGGVFSVGVGGWWSE